MAITERFKGSVVESLFKRRKINKNVGASLVNALGEADKNFQSNVAAAIRELQEAVEELQSFKVVSNKTDKLNRPKHLSTSQLFQGQFLRLTSTGTGNILVIQHGLQRVPQGGLFTEEGPRHNRIYIGADKGVDNVPPADASTIHVKMMGAAGEEATLLLF